MPACRRCAGPFVRLTRDQAHCQPCMRDLAALTARRPTRRWPAADLTGWIHPGTAR